MNNTILFCFITVPVIVIRHLYISPSYVVVLVPQLSAIISLILSPITDSLKHCLLNSLMLT